MKFKENSVKTSKQFFKADLKGEGAADYGGPFREVLTSICEEITE